MMKIKDKIYMSPIGKYQKYGRYPWKMVIHLLLIVFTTCQVMLIVLQSTTYAYNQYTLWNSLFLNHDIQGSTNPIVNSFTLFSTNHISNYIKVSVDRFYDINSFAIDNYDYHYESDGTKKPPRLLVKYLDYAKSLKKGYLIEYKLTNNNLGPFSQDADSYLEEVKSFRIEYTLVHKLNKYVDTAHRCYVWDITQVFDYSSHGVVTASLETNRKTCYSNSYSLFSSYNWLGLIVIFLSLASLITVARYFYSSITYVSRLTGSDWNFSSAWEHLGILEKLKFINLWIVFTIIGNLFQLFGGILSLFSQDVILTTHEAIIGFGCFCAWVGSVRFLDHTSKSYIIVTTLSRSFKIIGPYIIGIVPIFMAYVLFAICAFWETGIYPNVNMGMIAAYAVVNGDSVYAFGLAEHSQNSFFGQLYFYSFVVFFICFVQMVFIAIIQKSYQTIASNPPKQWVEEMDKTPGNEDSERKGSESNINIEKSSELMYKKILNYEKKEKLSLDTAKEESLIEEMRQITEETCALLKSLHNLIASSQEAIILQKFRNIIEQDLEPILAYFI